MCWQLNAHAQLPASVSDALTQAGIPLDSVSVYVRQVDQPKALVNHNAGIALNPASTMKLLTTYAGLELLGPAYRWRTELYREGELVNGELKGNLVIKGYGDPGLMAEDLWRLLGNLRQAGVKNIRGDLIIDNSYFAPQLNDAAVFDHEPYRAYNATPGALNFNLKSTSFKFSADAQRVSVQAEPELAEIKVENQVKPSAGECGDWKSQLSYTVSTQNNQAMVTFGGKFAADCGEKYLDLSLFNDAAYDDHLFRKIWQQLGGTISGGWRMQALPQKAVKLMQYDSPTLADMVRRINKYSNNFMARQLLLTIAAEQGNVPATEPAGDKAIRGWLQSKALNFPELALENGAGLSRNERISAEHLGELLISAYASPVMPELMSSLPVLAVDGTTNRRMKDSVSKGRAHLKTGSLDGVRAIAGYMLDQDGKRWVMVFMVNHARAGASRPAQDALLDWVFHHD